MFRLKIWFIIIFKIQKVESTREIYLLLIQIVKFAILTIFFENWSYSMIDFLDTM